MKVICPECGEPVEQDDAVVVYGSILHEECAGIEEEI